MTTNENDPDTLQILDELEIDWVKLWKRAANQKKLVEYDLTLITPKLEKSVVIERARQDNHV